MNIIFLCLLSYIIGSIPSAYIITKIFKGIDIREVGSGNPGTTNVIRTTGFLPGVITFILDFTKGILSLWFTKHYLGDNFLPLSMFFVIIGHTYSIFLTFRGGKGVATFFGTLLVISPKTFFILAIIFCIIFLITHIISVSSITAVLTFFVLSFIIPELKLYSYTKIFFFLTTVLIICRHKSNILRLLSHEEKKLW